MAVIGINQLLLKYTETSKMARNIIILKGVSQ